MNEQPSILMIMPYFGCWPEWMDLYIESCKWNPTINWLFFTDCGEPNNQASNVAFVHTTLTELEQRFSDKLGIKATLPRAYKLCDYKPTYGFVFEEYLSDYDFWGFGDIDVIYGNIRHFYGADIAAYKIISTHDSCVSGHFCLLQNSPLLKNAYRKIKGWQSILENPSYLRFDEGHFTNLILRRTQHRRRLQYLWSRLSPSPYAPVLFVERHSTILSPQRKWRDGTREYPGEWYWKEGCLTTDKDGETEFLYLHFMRWKSSEYLVRQKDEKAAWETLEQIVHVDPQTMGAGFKINRTGFHLLA